MGYVIVLESPFSIFPFKNAGTSARVGYLYQLAMDNGEDGGGLRKRRAPDDSQDLVKKAKDMIQAVSKATQDVEEAHRDFDIAKNTMDAKKEVLAQKKLHLQFIINTEGGQHLSVSIVFPLRFVGEDTRSF